MTEQHITILDARCIHCERVFTDETVLVELESSELYLGQQRRLNALLAQHESSSVRCLCSDCYFDAVDDV